MSSVSRSTAGQASVAPGVPVADLTDEKSNMPSGFIGLQVHGIKQGTGPYEVRWRNIRLKDLSKK